jgi:hypothetical protein
MEHVPGFVRVSLAWYAASSLGSCAERICISNFNGSQRVSAGELIVEWATAGEGPELRVRQAGWDLLARDFSGLLRHMTRIAGPISPDDFCAMLLRLGYADMTVAERPANVLSLSRLG